MCARTFPGYEHFKRHKHQPVNIKYDASSQAFLQCRFRGNVLPRLETQPQKYMHVGALETVVLYLASDLAHTDKAASDSRGL